MPISHGSEEIEAVCIIDTLRRAEIEVTVGKVDGKGGDLKDSELLCHMSRKTMLVTIFKL